MTYAFKRLALGAAALAGTSLAAIPAAAADLPLPDASASQWQAAAPVFDASVAETAANHRYRPYRYRYRRGPNVGDVLTGILILGTIGAVIDAVEGDDDRRYRDRDYRDRDYRDRDYRRDDRRRGDYRDYDSRGLDRAVGMCIDAVESRARVGSVEKAERDASGWEIEGSLSRGGSFECAIDNSGRIRELEIDGDDRDGDYRDDYGSGYGSDYEEREYGEGDYDYRGASSGAPVEVARGDLSREVERQGWAQGAQYDDAVYARLRVRGDVSREQSTAGPEPRWDQPASRPIEGDGRYDVSEVGDFEG